MMYHFKPCVKGLLYSKIPNLNFDKDDKEVCFEYDVSQLVNILHYF
jgi:hypothetical protein